MSEGLTQMPMAAYLADLRPQQSSVSHVKRAVAKLHSSSETGTSSASGSRAASPRRAPSLALSQKIMV
eukprot:16439457-Heterocapsa_arctica.AAC.1